MSEGEYIARALQAFDMSAASRPVCGCTPPDTPAIRQRLEAALAPGGPVDRIVSAFREAGTDDSFVRVVLTVIVGDYLEHAAPHDGRVPPAGYCRGVSSRSLQALTAALTETLEAMTDAGVGALPDGQDPRENVQGAIDDLRIRRDQTRAVECAERGRRERRRHGAPERPLVHLAEVLDRWLRGVGIASSERHHLLAGLLTALDIETTPERVRLSIKNRRKRRPGANPQKS